MFDWLYDLTSSNPILMLVFGIALLVFWWWIFVKVLGVSITILHFAFMFLLPFRLDDKL